MCCYGQVVVLHILSTVDAVMLRAARVKDGIDDLCVPVARGAADKVAAILAAAPHPPVVVRAGGRCCGSCAGCGCWCA